MAAVRVLIAALVMTSPVAARKAPAPPPAVSVPVAPTIKTGVEKWRAGDYPAAVAIWTPFAAAGEADALFNMGQAYKLGRGVAADPAMARDFYRKAAAKGHLPAQANLGIALFQAGEKPEAVKWLKTAADRGEARAQYVLGIATFNGDGVPRSQAIGYGYLLRAQASGLPQAVTALGSIAPGLAPPDRSAGEAVAASLAAGGGVPPAMAAATAPRLIPATPPGRTATSPSLVTLPAAVAATGAPTVVASAPPPPRPTTVRPVLPAAVTAAPLATSGSASPLTPGQFRPVTSSEVAVRSASTVVDKPAPTAVPRPSSPMPGREPDAVSAETVAATRRPAVATVDVPPSLVADAVPGRAVPRDVASLPPRPTDKAGDLGSAHDAARPTTAAGPPPRSLKPFEVADALGKKPDGWRVQLGAFSTRKLADAAWTDVKAAAAPAKPLFATDGPVTKLQMGPFATRDAAKAACTKLTSAGRACFVTQG